MQEFKYDYANGFIGDCDGNTVTFNQTNFLLTGSDGLMDVGRGYFIPNGTNAIKYFDGDINNGDLTFPVYETNVVVDAAWNGNDWNLVGNPYPSRLDATAFWNSNVSTNGGVITDALHFWDVDDYASWNLAGGVANGSGIAPNGIIDIAQGFFVVAASSGNLEFNNAMRDTTNTVFYKKENENHNVWISVKTPSGVSNTILVGYTDNATDGFDPSYDAHKLSGSENIRFSSMLNNQEFIIQSLAPIAPSSQKVIPLTVFTSEFGTHTFSEFDRKDIDSGINIYLRDQASKALYDLSKGNYTVQLEGDKTYNHRFELVFENNNIATSVAENEGRDKFELLTTENGYILRNNDLINGDIQLTDITGKVIWIKNEVNNNQVEISLDGLSSGVYLITVTRNTSCIYTNKLVK